MANEVVLPKSFNVNHLSYGPPKQQTTGGKTIFVAYSGQQFHMQTPAMKAPFGVSKWASDNGGPDKYSFDLSFEGREQRESIQAFFDALTAIDKRLVQDAMENSQLWFKKKYPSLDVVEALYSPTVRYSKDRETGEVNTRYAPTFKMSLPFKEARDSTKEDPKIEFLFPSFGANREQIDLFEAFTSGRTKSARVTAIVQCSAVWIVGSKFGLMWKVRQLKLEEPVRLTGYAFQATEDDAPEDDEHEAVAVAAPPARARAPAAPSAAPTASTATRMMAESDDEENGAQSKGAPLNFVDEEGLEP
jgi:hypothetical protein